MMKNIIFFIYIFCFINLSHSDEKEVIVNDVLINKNLIQYIKNEVKKEGIDITEDMEKNIIKRLIDLELIYQQAKMDGLTSQSEFLSKSELAFKELIYTTYLQKFIKENKVSKKDIKKTYDEFITGFKEKEYRASHILVKTKNQAVGIIKSLKRGGDFDELAKINSIDEQSKISGGDLGWFAAQDMVKSFSIAIKKLVPNEVTEEPVQSQFGWHIIKLKGVKSAPPPSLEEKIDDIKNMLKKSKLKKYLDDLRLTADIKN
jgi:peptidyl-prolyl cis-trans isomerase C